MEILHSRAVDLNPNKILGRDPAGLVVAHETPRISLEEKDSKRALWVSSTSLPQSAVCRCTVFKLSFECGKNKAKISHF